MPFFTVHNNSFTKGSFFKQSKPKIIMANTPEPTKASSSSSSSKQNSTPTPTPTRRPQVLDARALRDLNQQRRTAPRLPTSPEDIRKTPQYKAAARRFVILFSFFYFNLMSFDFFNVFYILPGRFITHS